MYEVRFQFVFGLSARNTTEETLFFSSAVEDHRLLLYGVGSAP